MESLTDCKEHLREHTHTHRYFVITFLSVRHEGYLQVLVKFDQDDVNGVEKLET